MSLVGPQLTAVISHGKVAGVSTTSPMPSNKRMPRPIASVESIVHARALLEILWDVDSQDSLRGDYAEIAHKVIAGLKPGSIVLMHENHGQTIRALPYIFAALRRLHLRAVSIPELLTDDPPSLAQLNAGFTGCGLAIAPKGD